MQGIAEKSKAFGVKWRILALDVECLYIFQYISDRLQGVNVRHLGGNQLPNGRLHLYLVVRHLGKAHKLRPRQWNVLEIVERRRQVGMVKVVGHPRLRHSPFRVVVEQFVELVLLRIAQSEEARPALLRVLREELGRGCVFGGVAGLGRLFGGRRLEQFGGSLTGSLRVYEGGGAGRTKVKERGYFFRIYINRYLRMKPLFAKHGWNVCLSLCLWEMCV